jgi:hypothetical protein
MNVKAGITNIRPVNMVVCATDPVVTVKRNEVITSTRGSC